MTTRMIILFIKLVKKINTESFTNQLTDSKNSLTNHYEKWKRNYYLTIGNIIKFFFYLEINSLSNHQKLI